MLVSEEPLCAAGEESGAWRALGAEQLRGRTKAVKIYTPRSFAAEEGRSRCKERRCDDRFCKARSRPRIAARSGETQGRIPAVQSRHRLIAIAQAVAGGELTPSEAGELSRLIESFTRAVEMHDLEARLTKLEQATGALR
jgi:hypothetical protein